MQKKSASYWQSNGIICIAFTGGIRHAGGMQEGRARVDAGLWHRLQVQQCCAARAARREDRARGVDLSRQATWHQGSPRRPLTAHHRRPHVTEASATTAATQGLPKAARVSGAACSSRNEHQQS